MADDKKKPRMFMRIIDSGDKKLPKDSIVEVSMKNGKAKVISEPIEFPKDRKTPE